MRTCVCSIKTADGRTALDTAATTETASVFDGRMELALERVKLMTRAAKDRAKMEGDMRRQAEVGIEAMVNLLESERDTCADMERLLQEGQSALERDKREALEMEARAEDARKTSADGWGEAWEMDPEEVSISDISLGGGNTSALFLGSWQHLDVAVRQFEWSGSVEQADLFCRAMGQAASLRHPHLVLFLGAVVDGGDAPMVVQELCEQDIASTVKQGIRNQAPMEAQEVARNAIDMLLAVRYLHEKGVVHGSITSRKLLLDREGRAKLQYLPREAIRHAPEYCGSAEDIFDCGAVIVEMARGIPVTSSDNYHIKQALSDVPWPRLRDVAAKCLAQAPDDRPTARAVVDMLRMCQ